MGSVQVSVVPIPPRRGGEGWMNASPIPRMTLYSESFSDGACGSPPQASACGYRREVLPASPKDRKGIGIKGLHRASHCEQVLSRRWIGVHAHGATLEFPSGRPGHLEP